MRQESTKEEALEEDRHGLPLSNLNCGRRWPRPTGARKENCYPMCVAESGFRIERKEPTTAFDAPCQRLRLELCPPYRSRWLQPVPARHAGMPRSIRSAFRVTMRGLLSTKRGKVHSTCWTCPRGRDLGRGRRQSGRCDHELQGAAQPIYPRFHYRVRVRVAAIQKSQLRRVC